jgi:hypothetical protein
MSILLDKSRCHDRFVQIDLSLVSTWLRFKELQIHLHDLIEQFVHNQLFHARPLDESIYHCNSINYELNHSQFQIFHPKIPYYQWLRSKCARKGQMRCDMMTCCKEKSWRSRISSPDFQFGLQNHLFEKPRIWNKVREIWESGIFYNCHQAKTLDNEIQTNVTR